jgi:hypothetical protein
LAYWRWRDAFRTFQLGKLSLLVECRKEGEENNYA